MFWRSRWRGGFTGEKTAFWGCSITFLWERGPAGQGAFRSPPGPLRGLAAVGCIPLNRFPVESKEQLSLCIRRCKITLSTNRRPRFPTGAPQTVKKTSGGVGGAAAPLTFLRVSRLCRLRGSLILLAKSIPYKFGRPLVDRICFLEKVASATFSTRCGAPAFQRGRQGNAQPTAQFSRLSPQKNRATVPGPVWLPMVVPI